MREDGARAHAAVSLHAFALVRRKGGVSVPRLAPLIFALCTALAAKGFRVIRFWNHDVLGDIEGVIHTVAGNLADPTEVQS